MVFDNISEHTHCNMKLTVITATKDIKLQDIISLFSLCQGISARSSNNIRSKGN